MLVTSLKFLVHVVLAWAVIAARVGAAASAAAAFASALAAVAAIGAIRHTQMTDYPKLWLGAYPMHTFGCGHTKTEKK